MVSKVTEALEKVCALARGVFRRKLHKICDIPSVVCFMPKGQTLFGQISYIVYAMHNQKLLHVKYLYSLRY